MSVLIMKRAHGYGTCISKVNVPTLEPPLVPCVMTAQNYFWKERHVVKPIEKQATT